MAPGESTGWPCNKCTFINEDEDATICGMCQDGTRAARKAKGRLRGATAMSKARATATTASPPVISSFSDAMTAEQDGDSAKASSRDRTKNGDRKRRAGKSGALNYEEEEGEEE
ncbi:unnamed protein product, partial [Pylaiella littoralis]